MRYAIIRNGLVENVCEWDGESTWAPPDGTTVEAAETITVGIGWQWNGGQPIDPNPPTPPPLPPTQDLTPAQKLAAVGLTSDDLKQLLGLK